MTVEHAENSLREVLILARSLPVFTNSALVSCSELEIGLSSLYRLVKS